MKDDELKNQIRIFVENHGYEFVDILIKGSNSNKCIQCYIDREGGIQINNCVSLNRMLREFLEGEIMLGPSGNFRLDVSSPGIDRPLKNERDFLRNTGRDLEIIVHKPDVLKVTGTLVSVKDGVVEIRLQNEYMHIPISTIVSAKVKLKW